MLPLVPYSTGDVTVDQRNIRSLVRWQLTINLPLLLSGASGEDSDLVTFSDATN